MRMRMLAIVIAASMMAACSSKLTTEKASELLRSNSLLEGLSPIEATAISQGDNGTEAIARVKIADQELSFKFRRYDDGWRWEFAETKTGGWVAPDVVASQLQETQRIKRVANWAAEHRVQYEKTVKLLNVFSDNLPRKPGDSFSVLTWQQHREMWRGLLRTNTRRPVEERQREIDELANTKDAWNHEFLLNFEAGPRTALFMSVGPDGEKSTADDVTVVVAGQREWDDFYDGLMFNYYKSWQVPEGIEDLAKPFVSPRRGQVTTSKIVK